MSRPGRLSLRSRASAALLLLLGGCVTPPVPAPVVEVPPSAPREFRAAWVATVANIDWPSKPGLPADQQHAEMIAILDRALALKLNAIIFQVRPAADALYASSLEPWSEYLTGTQGRDPGYDPLAAWVREAHRRGLELHAWFNPYRARHHAAKSPLAATHLGRTRPDIVKKYGELLWMDPGEPFAAERTLAVISDVVRRYDIDGVHLDDYFYPYPITQPLPAGAPKTTPGEEVDFPDTPAWRRYQQAGGRLVRADWRRQNVDRLVEQIHHRIHALKPWVKFGVSPFGLGRPDRRPPGIQGFSQYDKLYADVEKWVEQGWMDYLTPQLYWPASAKAQSFEVLLDYWAKLVNGRFHLWPGLFTSAITDTAKGWSVNEIPRQIDTLRAHPPAGGHIHFSMIALLQDRAGISTALQAGAYAQSALIPASPWLAATPPPAPQLLRPPDGRVLITPTQGSTPARFAVWQKREDVWSFSVQPAGDPVVLPAGAALIFVSAVDRVGNESPRVSLSLPGAASSR